MPALERVLYGGYVTEGPRVKEFENRFGEMTGSLALAVNSGTSALTLALRLAGVGAGDEVVTTPMTCTATNLPILSLGGRPVWADVDPATGLIDPDDVAKKITPRTRAVMCVDWGGMPCRLVDLMSICRANGIKLIEDAAHALGARYMDRPIGSWADMTCFSLQAIKHITTVDGGMLAFSKNDYMPPEGYRRGRLLRWFGIDREAEAAGDSRIDVDIEDWGYKFHMNDVAATIGLVQLDHLNSVVADHQAHAGFYDDSLSRYFERLRPMPGAKSSCWLYTILLPSRDARDRFRAFMLERGIQVSRVHRRNDEYAVFKQFGGGRLPGVTEFSDRMICIPIHWNLGEQDLFYIVDACDMWAQMERT